MRLRVAPKEPEASKLKKKKTPKEPKARKDPTPPKPKGPAATKDVITDPDAMFKIGFLADVYSERPIGSEGISKVVTRFPPEPNGFLHLGHTKAIMINFGFAEFHGGECILRFDDTNPSGEEEKFFVAIEEIIDWLGFKPVRVTSSSDNFLHLYELAEDLINRDGAYVCHCAQAEVVDQRGGKGSKPRYACPHRDRPIPESLTEFRAMRAGKYQPQEAVLRMKQDLESSNPQMWDLAAYRVPEKCLHHKTGDEWKIYPTYDFTHCLCDSFEGITHSLCTTEFELSRVSYEWLCDKPGIYKPMQREFGRLNLSDTVLSKRKIITLIENGHVHDWDDPRLYTLVALRRRGGPPGALLAFVNELGVTKAPTTIGVKRLEQLLDFIEMVELPFSKDPEYGRSIHQKVYIDRDDFRETASKDFFRLALSLSVGLWKVPYPITATGFEKDPETGLVMSVRAHYEKSVEGTTFKKPKTYIHWIADCPITNRPVKATVRVFNSLFNSDSPDTHPEGFLSANAMIETGFVEIRRRAPWPIQFINEYAFSCIALPGGAARPETVRFQGMRIAYFCVDRDVKEGKLVLNRIVSLKEDPKKS
ncbi:glutaminyl-tRNA synthetase [Stipitochalara longipes BDJ]|nr:glutaminyl-tRNA synthetase [Stipitochalara longipes BDJ]